jgi:parvulin-like peptidyl-prolyl isomerase
MCQTLNKVWLIFTAILFFIPNCTKNETDNIIAKVGTLSISVEEFKDAYQFNPHLSSVKNPQIAKQIVLRSLIAEKIIARQGYEKNIQNQSRIKLQSDQYEREAIIEKFWQEKIFNEITVPENELLEAYYKSKKEKIIQFINYNNERQAYNDYQKIKEGLSFEEIAGLNGLPLNCIPADTIKMFGKLPNLEEKVFSMKMNEVSAPVKEGKFYFIVKLTGERENIFTSEMDFAQQRKKIQKELKKSKSFKNFQNYVNTYLSSDNFKLDKTQFKELVRKTENKLFEKPELNQSKSNEYLLDIYFDNAKNNRDQFLKQPVVKFSNGTTWDTGTLLQRIAVSPYTVDKRSKGAFRHSN